MPVKAVLFDMDGVLIHSEPVHMRAAQQVLKKRGLALTEAQYNAHFLGRTDAEGFRRYGNLVGATLDLKPIIAEKTEVYAKMAAYSLEPCPGVVEFVAALRTNGLPLALVTGSWQSQVDLALAAIGLSEAFNVVVAAEHITHSKPHPEGYLKAAGMLGVQPADCIVIEDAPDNIRALAREGIRSVAVTTMHNAEELGAAGASVVVDTLTPDCLTGLM